MSYTSWLKALAFRKVGRSSTINFLRALSSTAALTINLCIRSWSLILLTAANRWVDTCLISLSTVCVCRLWTWRTHNTQKKNNSPMAVPTVVQTKHWTCSSNSPAALRFSVQCTHTQFRTLYFGPALDHQLARCHANCNSLPSFVHNYPVVCRCKWG